MKESKQALLESQETGQYQPELITKVEDAIKEIVDFCGKEAAHDVLDSFYNTYLMDTTEDGLTRNQAFEHFLVFRNLQKAIRLSKSPY